MSSVDFLIINANKEYEEEYIILDDINSYDHIHDYCTHKSTINIKDFIIKKEYAIYGIISDIITAVYSEIMYYEHIRSKIPSWKEHISVYQNNLEIVPDDEEDFNKIVEIIIDYLKKENTELYVHIYAAHT